ncbi:MAG: hypothetical protein IPH46_07710 [Bacteroidetes bacterium]|nr:hypothetical protein [Bacteroidota bacterium]
MNGNNSSYKEDFNFSFIEYGGSNITHWTFGDEEVWEKIKASKISTKMLVVADKDSTETKPNLEKAKRLKNLKELLGDQFQIIDGREIENILSPEVLVETIKSLERNNADNIEYKQIMLAQEKYLNKPLGRFIVQQFQNINRKYEAKSGTISCKLDFCRAALEKLRVLTT